jgi:Flp pilus assembly protein TadG
MLGKLRRERGQATVELVLATPLLAFILFAIIEFGITYNHYLNVTDAVRVGAREAEVTRDSTAATAATIASASGLTGFDASKVTVCWTPAGSSTCTTDPTAATSGSDVTVSAKYPYSITLLGMTLMSGDLTSSTTERVE